MALRNCVIKRGRTDELEILVNTESSLIRSPKKFKVREDEVEGLKLLPCPVVGTLEEVKDIRSRTQTSYDCREDFVNIKTIGNYHQNHWEAVEKARICYFRWYCYFAQEKNFLIQCWNDIVIL